MKTGIIYRARNKENGMSYIGATMNFAHRKSGHKTRSKDGTRRHPFYQAIREFGWEVFEWSVLYKDVSLEMLEVAEMCAIYTHDTCDNGYNTTLGGKGQTGGVWTEVRRINQSIRRTGIPSPRKGCKLTEEHKRKLSFSHLGHKAWNKGTCGVVKAWNRGQKCSDEWRLKNCIGHGGRPFSVWRGDEHIGEWINQSECARHLSLNRRAVYSCLRGKRPHHKGYIFRYKE